MVVKKHHKIIHYPTNTSSIFLLAIQGIMVSNTYVLTVYFLY
jgi:hypothetical protein